MGQEAKRLEFVVHHDAGQTTQNRFRTLHWRAQHRETLKARLAGFRAWVDGGCPRLEERVRVSVVVRRARALDPGNLSGAVKGVLDGVLVGVKRGEVKLTALLPDDSARWVESVTCSQETGREWKGREQVIVVVETITSSAIGISNSEKVCE